MSKNKSSTDTKKKWKFWKSKGSSKTSEGTENDVPKPKITMHDTKTDKELVNKIQKNNTLPSNIYVSPDDSITSTLGEDETGVIRRSPKLKKDAFNFSRPGLLPPMKDDDETNVSSLLKRDTLSPTKSNQPKSRIKKQQSMREGIKGTFLTSTKAFKQLVQWAFAEVDTDKSGTIDKEELYTGMLLIHLKLATYLGPAATSPLSRSRVYSIFATLDTDNSGTLDINEFTYVMTILCSQIVSRIVITMVLSLLVIPYLTISILFFSKPYIMDSTSHFARAMDPYYVEYRPYFDTMLYHACTEVDLSTHIPTDYVSIISPYLPTNYFSCTILSLTTYSLLVKQSLTHTTVLILFYLVCTYHNHEYITSNIDYIHTLPSIIIRSILVTIFVPSAMTYIDTFFKIIASLTKKKVKVVKSEK